MTNSYECQVLGLYQAMFKDIAGYLPTVGGLKRDENRLLSTVRTRGFRFLTIDMPSFGKHFDKCLSNGRLLPSSIPSFGCRGSNRPIPAFLQGLIMRVFAHDGELLSQPCITSIFFVRQLCYAVKKIKIECSENVRERTLHRYITQEQSVRPATLDWRSNRIDCGPLHSVHLMGICGSERRQPSLFGDDFDSRFCDTVHDVADRISTSFGEFNADEWRPKHGPGAVADRPVGGYKYAFPTWSDRLEAVFPSSLFAYANYDLWIDGIRGSKTPQETEVPSFVLTVPKSQKAPRIIAKEPTANMWCQQAIREFLESRIADSPLRQCIHFKDQSFNGQAALKASHTQSHWTVDLSDASDRMSLWLVERVFRRNHSLIRALHSARSAYTVVRTRDGDALLQMKKFAPQGSATTFPLQTIVYSILAISSVIHTRGWPVSDYTIRNASKEVLVFGDDSIVPEDSGRQYVALLTYCGFTVNDSKTFGTGKFRESCGVDGYDGVDVTPAYITNPYNESDPTSVASTVECSNNFFKKGLWHSAAALESTLPRWMRNHLLVTGPGDGRFGLDSFVGSRPTNKVRWNGNLHREESLALCLKSTETKRQIDSTGHYLQYFTEAPKQEVLWTSGASDRISSSLTKRWEPIAA